MVFNVRSCLFALLLAAALGCSEGMDETASVEALSTDPALFAVPDGNGSIKLTGGWKIQSSAVVGHDGATISQRAYSTKGWLPISEPETLMAGLLENGRYPDIFFSDNLAKVPTEQFDVTWWYREQMNVHPNAHPNAHPRHGEHTFLVVNGIGGEADLWLNGVKLADRAQLQGSYGQFEYDITEHVREGANAIALEVSKNNDEFNTDPTTPVGKHLTLNMVDWNPPSPDRYTGLQFAPELKRTGPVSMRNAHVLQHNADDMSASDLTVKAELRNHTDATQRIDLSGSIRGDHTHRGFAKHLILAPRATEVVTITAAEEPQLHLSHPDVWWPYQMGAQPLYRLEVSAEVGGQRSDQHREDFGIRTVTSRLTPVVPGKTLGPDGYRQFLINGVPFVVRGGGWSQDMFLRYAHRTAADQLDYVKNLGLNAIRFEGNFPPDDLFDQLDRAGILALTGWQCCDRWEDDVSTWDDHLRANAANQAAHVAQTLRRHPSVFTFFLGSDQAPGPDKEAIYLDAFAAADWQTPLVASAWYRSSGQLGPSGSKEGSYNYAPPSYWWANGPESATVIPDLMFLFNGSGWGFESEASPGNTIPTQDSLDRFLTVADQKKIWDPITATGSTAGEDLFHTSAYTEYYKVARMGVYNTALWNRYGHWSDMASYQRIAQLGQYEVNRALFEAYIGSSKDPANPTTGIIYWMLNKAWPSLQWSLFGTDFDQAGGYFGAKKANEPVHILYSYGDGSIKVANLTNTLQTDLHAEVELVDLDGTVRHAENVAVPALSSQDVQTVLIAKAPPDMSRTYFVKLTLRRGALVVSRNDYWLSTKPDTVDWETTHANFQGYANFTPDGYADLTGLQQLAEAPVQLTASTALSGSEAVTRVTITHVGESAPALLIRGDLFAAGQQVLPIQWSDNDLTLWPGESRTIAARYRAADLRGSAPTVRLTGFNVQSHQISAPVMSPSPSGH